MKMDKALALKALQAFDRHLTEAGFGPVTLAVGGGGSMDIDAVPTNANFEALKPFIQAVSEELELAADWLNPHYGTYTVYLSKGAQARAHVSFVGQSLTVKSLSAEDVLIMKFMANRSKDLPHIRHLLRQGAELSQVEDRLIELQDLFPKVAEAALTRFYEETEEA